MLRRCGALLLLVLALCAAAGGAQAHPHVFVLAREEITFDADGRVASVGHAWRFDEGFSAFATQGLDSDRDGVFSQEELAPLAQVNVESLKEYGYFTFVEVDGKQVTTGDPTRYWLRYDDGQLVLFFDTPLVEPVSLAGRTLRVDVYDPQYYVAFDLVSEKPFSLAGDVPKGCKIQVKTPEELDPQTAAMLAVIPPDVRDIPANLRSVTAALANTAVVTCPASATAPLAPGTSGPVLPRLGASGPFGVGVTESGSIPPTGVFAVIAEWQRAFYERLTDAVKRLKGDNLAVLTLIALSFGYGVFHAAGPGHGKAVIAAYLVANEATARRALTLSFLSAMLQAVVAVAIIGVAAALLNLTSFAITATARVAEIGSAVLVLLLGAVLVARKVLWPVALAITARLRRPQMSLSAASVSGGRPSQSMSRFVCDEPDPDHVHGPQCGHVVLPDRLSATTSRAAAVAAVVSAGARPCTGALVVLVFALSQGMFAAGVLAVFAMAVGTALTVSLLGLLAIGAKGMAMRLSGFGGGRTAGTAIAVLEGAASFGILSLGVLLLGAALAF
jgi:nickel/cobalt exporter